METVGGEIGRPRYHMEEERLLELLDMNLSIVSMAKLLGVSSRTVQRRMNEFGLFAQQRYSDTSDEELDDANALRLKCLQQGIGW